MKLNEIRDNSGAVHARKRRGRGIGSGLGKTGGRGHKGQKSRSGVALASFEGGQMPIYRRLPMRGFTNPSRKRYVELTLARLQGAIDKGRLDAGQAISAETLRAAGVIRRIRDGISLLGSGELSAKIEITVARATKSARQAVEDQGGTVSETARGAVTDTAG